MTLHLVSTIGAGLAVLLSCGPLAGQALAEGAGPASSLDGNQLYVNTQDPGCDDSRTRKQALGDPTHTFCSIQPAIDVVKPGDTINVLPGLYVHTRTLRLTRSGTSQKRVTLRSTVKGGAIIDGPDVDHPTDYGRNVYIGGRYITLEGFEIKGGYNDGIRNNGNHVVVRHNIVHDNGNGNAGCAASYGRKNTHRCGQGIGDGGGSAADNIYEYNTVYSNGFYSGDHNFYISSARTIVRNNIAYDAVAGYNFQIYPDCDDCKIYNNVAYGSRTRSGFVIGGEGAVTGKNIQAYNNIAMNNFRQGFWMVGNGKETTTMRNNLAFGNLRGPIAGIGSYDDQGMITSDPLLVNAAGADFHLSGTASPAFDAADSTYLPPEDIDGESRPIGSAGEIGVDEYDPSAPPTCTDRDLDGYGNPGSGLCPAGPQLDCDDGSGSVNPGATEVCGNAVDEDCDGLTPLCPESYEYYSFEAERGVLNGAVFEANPDRHASNAEYINPLGSLRVSTSPGSDATYTVTIDVEDEYYLWLRMLGPSGSSDALYIGLDGAFDRVYPESFGDYQWVRAERTHGTGEFSFPVSRGVHTINLGYGEPLVRADRILLTNNPTFTPSGPDGDLPISEE